MATFAPRNHAFCVASERGRTPTPVSAANVRSTRSATIPAAPDAAPLLRFESLEMIGLPVSVPDDLWRSRDAHAPQDNEEELPL